jgi:hypothetical protein
MERRLATLSLAALLALGACRNDDGSNVTTTVLIVPSTAGANGCSGPDQVFAAGQALTRYNIGGLTFLVLTSSSQITADAASETLFATGLNGQVVSIDVSGGAPVDSVLVPMGTGPVPPAGTVAELLDSVSITTAPVLSGIAVLDATTLLVVEQTSNTILEIDRGTGAVDFFAGNPDESGGFADGFAQGPLSPVAQFDFDRPTQLCPTDDPDGGAGSVYVADPGNHAVREIARGFVSTIMGTGAPFHIDGDLPTVGLDTPTGITARCSGTLLVTEEGQGSFLGGNRLRQAMLAQASFFSGSGMIETLAGDGISASVGGEGTAAELAGPRSPLSTSANDVYWIDAATGILRRMTGANDTVDCPLFADCSLAGGNFTAGDALSLTQTPAGVLFVLDFTADQLIRVTP